jgi:hypothetical protein
MLARARIENSLIAEITQTVEAMLHDDLLPGISQKMLNPTASATGGGRHRAG